jgi:hypothetical protein
MNQEQISSYLNSLGMGEPFQRRIRDLAGWFSAVIGATVFDMFVSDYVERSGDRRFSTVVMFGESAFLEAQKSVPRGAEM